MPDNSDINYSSSSEAEIRNRFFELTTKASVAENSGESMLAVNLYLAAYEVAKGGPKDILDIAVVGVKRSWQIVLQNKNRSMSEYIFEILSSHLLQKEIDKYSEELHNLMLDKLKNLGVPIEPLQETNNVSDALDKMKDFISGITKDKVQKKSNNNADEQKKSPVQNKNSINKNKNDDKDSYYVRRELNKYQNLVGYDNAISMMNRQGITGDKNSQYMQLVERLNKEHGLNRISFSKTMIFKSPSRVDANTFMEATASEIGLPCIQMHMDENIQGSSVLCMMAPADGNFKLNPGRTGFNGKGILMLEDIDVWDFPDVNELSDNDSIPAFISAQMSRGVAEITNLIDVALADPNILVMATVGEEVNNAELRKLLGSDNFTIVKVDNPTDAERSAIWNKLAADHPSLRAFSTQRLVNYSKNMSRYDIDVAVHEALEDAYRLGIKKGQYIPLSIVNIVEKLADHQPLGSTEYKTLEDVATADFKKDLENIDDILK